MLDCQLYTFTSAPHKDTNQILFPATEASWFTVVYFLFSGKTSHFVGGVYTGVCLCVMVLCVFVHVPPVLKFYLFFPRSSILNAACFLPSPSIMLAKLELLQCRRQSACNTCLSRKLCGKWHGSVTGVQELVWADNCWNILGNNCISV